MDASQERAAARPVAARASRRSASVRAFALEFGWSVSIAHSGISGLRSRLQAGERRFQGSMASRLIRASTCFRVDVVEPRFRLYIAAVRSQGSRVPIAIIPRERLLVCRRPFEVLIS